MAKERPIIEEAPIRHEDQTPRFNARVGYLTEDGRELPDSTPVAPPIGWNPQPSLALRMRQMIATELSRIAAEQDFETMEESDDFEVGDDFDPTSPYEYNFDPPIAAPVSPSPAPPAAAGTPPVATAPVSTPVPQAAAGGVAPHASPVDAVAPATPSNPQK